MIGAIISVSFFKSSSDSDDNDLERRRSQKSRKNKSRRYVRNPAPTTNNVLMFKINSLKDRLKRMEDQKKYDASKGCQRQATDDGSSDESGNGQTTDGYDSSTTSSSGESESDSNDDGSTTDSGNNNFITSIAKQHTPNTINTSPGSVVQMIQSRDRMSDTQMSPVQILKTASQRSIPLMPHQTKSLVSVNNVTYGRINPTVSLPPSPVSRQTSTLCHDKISPNDGIDSWLDCPLNPSILYYEEYDENMPLVDELPTTNLFNSNAPTIFGPSVPKSSNVNIFTDGGDHEMDVDPLPFMLTRKRKHQDRDGNDDEEEEEFLKHANKRRKITKNKWLCVRPDKNTGIDIEMTEVEMTDSNSDNICQYMKQQNSCRVCHYFRSLHPNTVHNLTY